VCCIGGFRAGRTEGVATFAKLAYIAAVKKDSLGGAIRRLRTQADYTLRGFAELVEISAAYLSDIEHDRRVPTDDVLKRIAKLLEKRVSVSFEELQGLSARLGSDVQRMVQETPEVGQLLREVRQSGRPAREVLRQLQQHLRSIENQSDDE
jgi:transcriptional regulator with XRE-family HTH domain